MRLLSRKFLKISVFNDSVLDWSLENEIRNSQFTIDAILFAKRHHYILESLSIGDLSYSELQRLIHIYWLHNFLIDNNK